MKDSYSQAEKDRLFLHYGIRHNTSLFTRLTDAFGEPGEICDAFRSGRSGSMHGIREDVVSKLTEAAKPGFVDRLCDRLSESGIRMTAPGEEDYPFLLEQIDNPPYLLFYKGKLIREPALPIGVIGSRRCTGYGKSIARMFSYDLARSGAVIVSGMAAGIDTEAARGALEAKESEYPTIAVLGTGIDVVYPKQNYELYNEIASRGALVSEFFLGDKPLPDHFPIRNRIISGLSKGVLVVEAGERSGSSITAGLALDQGRDLYAVPGRITDPMSVGTNRLIQRELQSLFFAPETSCVNTGYGTDLKEAVFSPTSPTPPFWIRSKKRSVMLYVAGNCMRTRLRIGFPSLRASLESA